MPANIKFIVDRYYLSFYFESLNIKNLVKNNFYYDDYMQFIEKLHSNETTFYFKKICKILKKYSNLEISYHQLIYLFFIYKYHYIILCNEHLLNYKNELNLKSNLLLCVVNLANYMDKFDKYDNLCILKLVNRNV